MLISSQQPYDESRQRDVAKMQAKIADPRTPEHERKKAKEVLYRLKYQRDNPSIIRQREKIKAAIQNGDRVLAEKLGKEFQQIDQDYRL